MPRDTTAHVRGGQAVPAHKQSLVCVCVCEPATQLLHLHLASSTHNSSSRGLADLAALWEAHPQCRTSPTCVQRRGTGPLLSIVGTKRRGPGPSHASMGAFFLPSVKCLWHIGCKGPRHTALCCAPLCALHSRLLWSMQPHHQHHHYEQQQQMRLSPLLARVTAVSAADACARQQTDRSHCH